MPSFPFDSRIPPARIDRRRGSYISRQNDPAYNREVQYTVSDHTTYKYNDKDVYETVRVLCKDQGLNIPNIPELPSHESFNVIELNGYVEYAMSLATPMPRAQVVSKSE